MKNKTNTYCVKCKKDTKNIDPKNNRFHYDDYDDYYDYYDDFYDYYDNFNKIFVLLNFFFVYVKCI